MNKHSILFKINILFAIAFIALLLMTFAAIQHESRERHHYMFDRLSQIIKVHPVKAWDQHDERLITLAGSHGLSIVSDPERAEVLSREKHFGPPGMDPDLAPPLRPLRDGQYQYLYYHDQTIDILFKENKASQQSFPLVPTILFAILLLLISMYIMLRKSLRPIQALRTQIQAYGEGKAIMPITDEKQDEISSLYREFYKSIEKVQRLTDTRRLFLRNIMHELNTPVAKGKIIIAMMEDINRPILENIFERLELLVKELAHVERLSSGNHDLLIRPYRIIDIIDHAKDMLFYDDDLQNDIDDETIECDLEMMSLVFKNLIDNSLKYGKDPSISYEEKSVLFTSNGDPLKYDLDYYTEPFVKGVEYETLSKGLGLGLYIVKDILIRQGYALSYSYHLGKNIFKITKVK